MKVNEKAVMRDCIEYALDDAVYNVTGLQLMATFAAREKAIDTIMESIEEKFTLDVESQ